MERWDKEVGLIVRTFIWQKKLISGTTNPILGTKTNRFRIAVPGLWEQNLIVGLMYQTSPEKYRSDKTVYADWTYEYFKADIFIEFFAGEKDLFDALTTADSSLTNMQKCLLLMKVFLMHSFEEENLLSTAFNDIASKLGVDVNLINDKFTIIKAKEDLMIKIMDKRGAFIEAISKRISYRNNAKPHNGETKNFPYLDLGKYAYRNIYGKNRNPYMNTFLYLYYKMDKPLLEKLIRDKMQGNLNQYNYKQYKAIESGIPLVNAATKYLTWGVEYTPITDIDNIDLGIAGNKVFTKNSVNIVDWIEEGTGVRANNYLHVPPKKLNQDDVLFQFDTTSPFKVQYIQPNITTNNFQISAKLKQNSTSLSKIDIWNSRNIAWEGIVDDVIAKVGDTDIKDSSVWKINDRDTFLEEKNITAFNQLKDASKTKNLHLKKGPKDKTIEVGYKFLEQQQVAGLLFVRGFADRNTYKDYTKGKYIYTSGHYDANYANKAIDDNFKTYWQGALKEKQWIFIDLGYIKSEKDGNRDIENVVITWGEHHATEYKIQIAPHGLSANALKKNDTLWKTAIHVTGGSGGVVTHNLKNNSLIGDTKGRFVRVLCLSAINIVNKYTISEIGVYDENPIKLRYKETESSDWKGLNFRDIAVDHSDNSFVAYPDFRKYIKGTPGNQRLPGYSLLAPYYTTRNTNLGYTYFIFDSPVNCKEIKLVDESKNEFLNISELMVFPEDPIKYITNYLINEDEYQENPSGYNFDGELDRNKAIAISNNNKNFNRLLYNGNPTLNISNTASGFKVTNSTMVLNVKTDHMTNIQQIILWEPNETREDELFSIPSDILFPATSPFPTQPSVFSPH